MGNLMSTQKYIIYAKEPYSQERDFDRKRKQQMKSSHNIISS